jgi:hypothetical protein
MGQAKSDGEVVEQGVEVDEEGGYGSYMWREWRSETMKLLNSFHL